MSKWFLLRRVPKTETLQPVTSALLPQPLPGVSKHLAWKCMVIATPCYILPSWPHSGDHSFYVCFSLEHVYRPFTDWGFCLLKVKLQWSDWSFHSSCVFLILIILIALLWVFSTSTYFETWCNKRQQAIKLLEWRQGRQQSDFWAAIFSMCLYIVLVFYTTPWTQVHLVIYYERPETFQKSCQTCLCPSCIYVADCSWKNVIACTSTKCITSVNFFRPSFQPIYSIFFTVCSANLMQKDCIQNNK